MACYSSAARSYVVLPAEPTPTSELTVCDMLQKICSEQVPSKEHIMKCTNIAGRVIAVLEKELELLHGHIFVAGSYGKLTAIPDDSDFDIVIFFPELEPPFMSVLCEMESALKHNSEKFNGFIWKVRSRIHLCFEIEGIKFDVSPASQLDKSFAWKNWDFHGQSQCTPYQLSAVSKQYLNTLKKIKELEAPEKWSYLYSSSLSLTAVTLVRTVHPVVLAVARLAKFWAKQVKTGKCQIRGKSLLFETIAISLCHTLRAEQVSNRHLDLVFFKFLELVATIRSLRLYVFINYGQEEIPTAIFNRTPLVMDPVNPFNNLLSPDNFPSEALKCFEQAAVSTQQKITNWSWSKGLAGSSASFRHIFTSL